MAKNQILYKTNNLHWGETRDICKPYGFIYITTNLINGKRYIGQKKFSDDKKWVKYLGSGTSLKRAIDKYGVENFTRSIVDIGYTLEELNTKEQEWISFYNAVESDDYYNLVPGGYTSDKSRPRPRRGLPKYMYQFSPSDAVKRFSIDKHDWKLMKLFDPDLSEQ